jgi:hypothetical protein
VRLCHVCNIAPVFRLDRCRACYRFHRRHGRDRSGEQLVALNQRRFEFEQRRLIIRRILAG